MVDPNEPADERLLELFGPVVKEANMTVTARAKSPYFGDVALTLRSDELELRLVSDQGLCSADIRPSWTKADWFDLSLLQMLLTGKDMLDGAGIESQAGFLHKKLVEVRSALAENRWSVTRRQLQGLERRRAARRFGPAADGR